MRGGLDGLALEGALHVAHLFLHHHLLLPPYVHAVLMTLHPVLLAVVVPVESCRAGKGGVLSARTAGERAATRHLL